MTTAMSAASGSTAPVSTAPVSTAPVSTAPTSATPSRTASTSTAPTSTVTASNAPLTTVRSTTALAGSAGRATLPVHQRTRATLTEQAIDATDPSPAAAPELIPVPQDQEGIDVLRKEIDAIDAELVKLILHRTAISHAIGTARKTLGGPKIVYSREMAILERFRALGPAGTDLGMLLLAMGRGRLGRK